MRHWSLENLVLLIAGTGARALLEGMDTQVLRVYFPIGWSYDIPLKMHSSVVDYNRGPFKRCFSVVQVHGAQGETGCEHRGKPKMMTGHLGTTQRTRSGPGSMGLEPKSSRAGGMTSLG